MASISPIQVFSLGADAVYLSKRDLPIAPDGYYDWQVSDDASVAAAGGHSPVTNLISRVEQVNGKGFVKPDPKVVAGFADLAVNSGAENDRLGAASAHVSSGISSAYILFAVPSRT